MSRNNDVFQILVADPAIAPVVAGSGLESLTDGQLGVFDAETNLAVDGTSPVRDFYIAVGVDADGDGIVDTLDKSSGQRIQGRNIRAYSFRAHTPAVPMVVELTDYSPKCDTDYGIKLEFRNQEIYRRQGYNQFSKSFIVRTSCCENCVDCEPGNVNELTKLFVNEINLDTSGIVIAEAIATEAITIAAQGTSADYAVGDVVSAADLDVLIAFNTAQADNTTRVSTGLRLTSVPLKVRNFCAINTNYFKPRGTVIIPSLVEGFNCTGTLTVSEDGAFEEGNGYDLKQREYHAAGWKAGGGPYRVNVATGLPREIEYRTDAKAKYDILALTYDQFSVAGWLEHLNNLATEIGFPTTAGGSTLARQGLITILDRIVAPYGFDALADDAAASSNDPTVSEPTENAASQNLDGIG